jgi:choline-sulfatase
MAKRPNILFLMSDEHRYDVAGFAGDEVVRTPVLDELARTGTVFTNAYTPSPVCVPGRQCMMAGQLPSTCRCLRYGDDLDPGYMTFARRFSEYAYRTVCASKLHHMGTDQMQGWTRRIAPDAEISDRHFPGLIDEELQRCQANASENVYTASGRGKNRWEVERAGPGEGPYQRFDVRATQAAVDYVTDHLINPYYDRVEHHRPLLLKLSLLQPHYPFLTDEAKFRYYLNRVPIYVEDRADHPVLSRSQAQARVDVCERDIRRATAAYYGMIETLDGHFGRLLEALREAGQDLDEWIIIYTSDHGDMMGQHGVWEKTRFYEGSVRVPLIIRWPKRFGGGRVIDRNVSLCDLFATLCDCAGLPVPDGLDSRSLIPLLEGSTADWDNEVVSQFGQNTMIKRDDLKYIYYGGDAPEVLFDLAADPGETVNVIDQPDYTKDVAAFRKRREELTHTGIGDALMGRPEEDKRSRL